MTPADAVLDAIDRHHLIELLSDCDPSLDEDGAYAIAWEVHKRRRERGERPVGRKIGFTNRTIWAEYGVWAPMIGAVGHALQARATPELYRLAAIGELFYAGRFEDALRRVRDG